MQHFLFVICALAFINMSKADPTGQLPSKINLTYPEDRVNLNQHFEMSWSVGNMDLDPTATGISDVGVILPNGTIYTNPYFPMTCGTRDSAAFLTMPGFALAGRYSAFWNITYFLASMPSNKGVKPHNHDKENCGSGPFKAVTQNFTATFEIADLGANATSKPSSTTIFTEFPSPTGTLASNGVQLGYPGVREWAWILLSALMCSALPYTT
jgi:hypothetical protein